jgi:hypothetical protein
MAYIEELQQAERRLSAMINARAEREELQLREDRAECMRAEREQAREDAERRREIQARYADSFSAFGTLVPPPLDNERPGRYRQRLFDSLQHKLPPNHDLAMVRSDELSSAPARRNFEQMLLEAAVAEGDKPSFANLPRDGSMVTRVRTDPDSGHKRTEYYGRRSFIHDLSMEPKRVVRIVDPKSQKVIWGPEFPSARRA